MNIPQFKNPHIFDLVFTHRSYLNEAKDQLESNERLEFLGDSILSYVVSSYIFNTYPNINEGELTNLRSILTNTQTLYKVSQFLNLGEFIKLSKGEEASGGRENRSILANTFEALIGGLYIDQGIDAASKLIQDTIIVQIDDIIRSQGLKDSKSKLQETIQEKHKVSPFYKIIKEDGPDHAKTYTVGVFLNNKLLAEGIGKSKQEAEKNAATNALTSIE